MQTKFLNPGAKKPITQNTDELIGPATISRTTTVAASATAFQIDATGGITALTNRRMIEIRVAGVADVVSWLPPDEVRVLLLYRLLLLFQP